MAQPWRAMDPLGGLADDSDDDSSDEETETAAEIKGKKDEKTDNKELNRVHHSGDKKSCSEAQAGSSTTTKPVLDYESLNRHGYQGGPSILFLPPSKQAEQQSWEWGQGKRKEPDGEEETESFAEREKFRQIANERSLEVGEQAVRERDALKKQRMDAAAERKAMSFAQKEKRKRDMGQASRGKSYVEEEKRLLRDSGVYSGFDG